LLPDPHHALHGTGKAIRHIKITSFEDLSRPFLPEYIRAAMAQVPGPEAVSKAVKKSVVRGNYPVKRRPARRA
jgi:hypothetical protein